MRSRTTSRWLAAAALLLVSGTAAAHRPSDGFLTLDIEGTTVSGQLDLALRDLEAAIGLDADGDRGITWGEVRAQQARIARYAAERVRLTSDAGPCDLVPLDLQVSDHSDGMHASLIFNTTCTDQPVRMLDVRYDALFDIDAQHRGLMALSVRDETRTAVFTSTARTYVYDAAAGGTGQQLAAFAREGVRHIFAGADHLLFLVALLLPAVFARVRGTLVPRERLGDVLWDTAKVVTGFTVAHSLSLCLTTLALVPTPPARAVEALVALTILLTAVNNVVPLVRERRWLVGFGFGLIHGIGYASVLSDLGLAGWDVAAPLVGFNLGVEAAQLVVLLAFLPVAYALRRTRAYRGVFLWGGSLATAALALGWMVEQAADLSFMPF